MLQATLEPGKNELRGGSNDRFRVHENNSCFLLPRRESDSRGRVRVTDRNAIAQAVPHQKSTVNSTVFAGSDELKNDCIAACESM